MKKFIFSLVAMFMVAVATVSAQEQSNYAGSSRFTDNWSVTLQGGMLTTFSDFYSGHTACAPIIVVGADKYITPWLGVGVDARTLIGTGHGKYNTHTAFDAINLSGLVKFNVLNAIKYDGTRKMFEPVVYTGLGWGHGTGSDATQTHANYLNWRSGVEFNFNLGKERAWAVVVNPSIVYGNPGSTLWATKLDKHNGMFELTAGVVYHFKNSNGKHSMSKPRLYDAAEVERLNKIIADLKARKPRVVEKIVEVKPTNVVAKTVADATYAVSFAQNSAVLTDAAKTILDAVPTNATVNVVGATSPEGSQRRNEALSVERAKAVADYLSSRGVTVNNVSGNEAGRVAIVTLVK